MRQEIVDGSDLADRRGVAPMSDPANVSEPANTPEGRFAALVQALSGHPGVSWGADDPRAKGRFGASGLKVGGKLFAMLVAGRLVVKLPRQRVDVLVAAGEGERYDPRRDGRLMKEWLAVEPASRLEWLPLAREAMAFVAANR
jgi:hypothetical protein